LDGELDVAECDIVLSRRLQGGWEDFMERPKRSLVGLLALGVLWLPLSAHAQASPETAERADAAEAPGRDVLGEAIDMRGQANTELSETQERIEELSDATDTLLTQYQLALRQHESLRTYNRQLEALIASQEVERASLQEQTDQVELVSRDVTPLMLRMIDALEAFVNLDVPFLEEERTERILDLRKLMHRADVTEAEKYRRIMEAYQIENEYGRTIEAYRSTLSRDGKAVTVNFLRVGRIALVYQSLDESQSGVWNQRSRSWEPLDDSLRSAVREGLRIARKQAAPAPIRLPLPAAQREES
jgi:Spy/CpxP family protein refolding chaperone